ncbi:MAG TPA: hypothetical protein VGM02_06025 [Acidobacteriaceae bacterium]
MLKAPDVLKALDVRKTAWLAMLLAAMMTIAVPARAQETHLQIPCPVMLVSGHVRGTSIELSFRNKGKVPIQQVSLGCSPPMKGQARDAICHTGSGLFYPGTPYTMEFAYTGARRGAVTLSVKGARLGTGELWMARSARACRPLVVRR